MVFPKKLYLTLKGKHNEIALKGRKHYLVERGPGYEIVNGVECIFTLTKTEVQELLGALEVIKAERKAIIKVAKILRPYYTQPNRDNIIFSLSGYLHKGKTSELTITRIAEQLIDITGYADENPSKIYQTIKDTCAKDPDSQQVSGYKRFHEALTAACLQTVK